MKYSKGDQFIYATYSGTWFVGEIQHYDTKALEYSYARILSDKSTEFCKSGVMMVGDDVYNSAELDSEIDKTEVIVFLFDIAGKSIK